MADRPTPASWLSPARWRPHLPLVISVASVALAIGLLAVFLAGQQQVPVQPTAAAMTATSPVTTTAQASPAGEIAWPPGSLPALLAMAPDWLGNDPGLPIQATYANIDGWLRATGSDPARRDDVALREAVAALPLPEPLRANGLTDAWRTDYGFDLRQVDAVLAVGEAPNLVLIMPGRYDADRLYATWVASGYQAVEVEETTVWSLAPGDRIDLSAPASQPSLGLLNTMVVLDDGTIIATSRQSLIAQALRVVDGRGDSLADHGGLREALPGSVDAVSAVLATGELVAAPPGEALPASPAADAALPKVELVLFTVPPTAAGRRTVEMTIVLADAADDPVALRLRVADRVAADPAWSARWRVESIRVAGEGRLIELAIAGGSGRDAGLELADPRELGPFRWSAGD